MVLCKCVFLDGKEVFLTVEKDATGSDLYDSICEYLSIKYRDPFGVAFRGGAAPAPYSWWVRMDKSLTLQIPGKCKIWEFAFLVKYYPKALTGMQDVMARHHVILQIRQDLLTGRLKCPVQTMSHLCSYWLQAEYGDWSSRHIDMQLADAFRFVQKGEKSADRQEGRSDLDFEEQMMQMHQTHRGMSTLDAEYRFIRLAASLPNYGIHYYPTSMFTQSQQKQGGRRSSILSSARSDASGKSEKVTIGVGPLGVHQFRRKENEIVYTWKAMRAVSFKKNRIVLKMQGALRQSDQGNVPETDTTSKKNLTKEYEFTDMFQTKIVWQVMIEYHMFFRVGDQKGLKGNQRKQLLNSLKVKRSIPMVGEKKVEAQSNIQPTEKNTPKSGRKSRFDFSSRSSKKRASSLPPLNRGDSGQREASPSRISFSNIETPRRQTDASAVIEMIREGERSARTPSIDITEPRPVRNVHGVASPSTPMSGTFVFPQRSVRSRSSSVDRQSTRIREFEVPFDRLSIASDDTDELCNPTLFHDAYPSSHKVATEFDAKQGNESITPRSQNTAYLEIPKLQLDDVDSKNNPDVEQKHDAGPFVIPAEILIEDLRRCKKLKEGVKIEEQNDQFPIELDSKYQPRRSRYLNDKKLMAAYDNEFLKEAESAYNGRRTRSLASLRPKRSGTDNRSSSRERSLSPYSEWNARRIPKTAVAETPQRRHPPRKAQSETRLPQTTSKFRNTREGARSSAQDDKQSVRPAIRGAQSARAHERGDVCANSGFVAHLSEMPAVKPRKSHSSFKQKKQQDSPRSSREMDDHMPTLITPSPELTQRRF